MRPFPTLGELAKRYGISFDTLVSIVMRLRNDRKLASVIWDEPEEGHDLSPEDTTTIRRAVRRYQRQQSWKLWVRCAGLKIQPPPGQGPQCQR